VTLFTRNTVHTWHCSHYRNRAGYRQVRTRSVTSNILARQRQRNGTELRRDGDVPVSLNISF